MEPISMTKRRWCQRCIGFWILLTVLFAFNIIKFEKTIYHSPEELQAKRINYTKKLVMDVPQQKDYGQIDIEYIKPPEHTCGSQALRARIEESRNYCWLECTEATKDLCKGSTVEWSEVAYIFDGPPPIYCAPKVMIVGMPRCGTQDLHEWLGPTRNAIYMNADFHTAHGTCAIDQARSAWTEQFRGDDVTLRYATSDHILYSTQPDLMVQTENLGLSLRTKAKNRTLSVRHGLLHLKDLTTPETRFVLMLRNPIHRVMSQLQWWESQGNLDQQLDKPYIHSIVKDQIVRLNKCFRQYGPTACVYLTNSKPGNLDTLLLWGMYSVYIEETMKFINKTQIEIINLEDYSDHERIHAEKVISFAGIELNYEVDTSDFEKTQLRRGTNDIKPLPSTITLLKEFYKPFNKRLAQLLNDKKWCYSSCE